MGASKVPSYDWLDEVLCGLFREGLKTVPVTLSSAIVYLQTILT